MLAYLGKCYLLATLTLTSLSAFVPLAFAPDSYPASRVIPRSLFTGGILAVGVVYWIFRRYNLWPLYDNLRLPKLVILSILAVSVQTVNVMIAIWLW